ncbi:hypothetical protein BH23CHL5_BH23CHL5_24710 [soil metagenome]
MAYVQAPEWQISPLAKHALTSFIGRERQVAELLALLHSSDIRLLTLFGPGGVGKTRLALSVTATIDSSKESHFVALAPITDPEMVITSIALALGVSGPVDETMIDRVAAALGENDTLLVLDNFERLVDAGPVLTELLARCPSLQVLVTSRAVLRVTCEYVFPVRPLELPAHDAPETQILESPAVRLFIDRAHHRTLRLTGETPSTDLNAVAEICHKLDGLPLAIELAAARTRMFDARQLAEHLESGIAILRHGPRDAPARLQSMHEMIAWSYDLLTTDEQALFRMVSAFSGGFTFRAAADLLREYLQRAGESFLDGESDNHDSLTADLILSLIDQSLVDQGAADDGQPRFALLETIREYGRNRLAERGETNLVLAHHAHHFAALARTRKPYLIGMPKVETDDPLHREHDNVRAAMDWSIEHGEFELAGWLACGLWPFCYRNGLYTEARVMFERVLENPHSFPPCLHADLLHNAGLNAHLESELDQTIAYAHGALSIYRSLGNEIGIAHCMCLKGLSTSNINPDSAASHFAGAASKLRTHGDHAALSYALDGLGTALMHTSDLEQARAAFTESVEVVEASDLKQCGFAPLGWVALAEGNLDLAKNIFLESLQSGPFQMSPSNRAHTLRLLGRIEFHRGQLSSAVDRYHEALAITTEIGAHYASVQCVAELAAVAQASGNSERSARWLSFDQSQRMQSQLRLSPDESSLRMGALEQATAAIGASEISAAWEIGSKLAAADAFAQALAWYPDVPDRTTLAASLTRRETQVLNLLADHCTNQEIADELFVSSRTVESHVASIFTKLDVHGRDHAVDVARARGMIAQ